MKLKLFAVTGDAGTIHIRSSCSEGARHTTGEVWMNEGMRALHPHVSSLHECSAVIARWSVEEVLDDWRRADIG
jgi:hypothetical protein